MLQFRISFAELGRRSLLFWLGGRWEIRLLLGVSMRGAGIGVDELEERFRGVWVE